MLNREVNLQTLAGLKMSFGSSVTMAGGSWWESAHGWEEPKTEHYCLFGLEPNASWQIRNVLKFSSYETTFLV